MMQRPWNSTRAADIPQRASAPRQVYSPPSPQRSRPRERAEERAIGLTPKSVLRHRPIEDDVAVQDQHTGGGRYVFRQGKETFVIDTDVPPHLVQEAQQRRHPPPLRQAVPDDRVFPMPAARPRQHPPVQQEEDDEGTTPITEDTRQRQRRVVRTRQHVQHHWLLYLGLGMLLMLALWFGITTLLGWVHTTLDDVHYGRPRTFQLDAVLGHHDSPAHPTHLIILNLNRRVEVIELPGGDATHARIYQGPTLIDPGSELDPVTATIQDVNGDGKPDLMLHIQDSTFVLINTGDGFRPLQPGEHVNV